MEGEDRDCPFDLFFGSKIGTDILQILTLEQLDYKYEHSSLSAKRLLLLLMLIR